MAKYFTENIDTVLGDLRGALEKAKNPALNLQCHIGQIEADINRIESEQKYTGLDESWAQYFNGRKEVSNL